VLVISSWRWNRHCCERCLFVYFVAHMILVSLDFEKARFHHTLFLHAGFATAKHQTATMASSGSGAVAATPEQLADALFSCLKGFTTAPTTPAAASEAMEKAFGLLGVSAHSPCHSPMHHPPAHSLARASRPAPTPLLITLLRLSCRLGQQQLDVMVWSWPRLGTVSPYPIHTHACHGSARLMSRVVQVW
jgi:hypothetical protein